MTEAERRAAVSAALVQMMEAVHAALSEGVAKISALSAFDVDAAPEGARS